MTNNILNHNILNNIKTNINEVYITFDDGPVINITLKILDILKHNNINASFFIIGQNISNNNILKRIVDENNKVYNHSYSHNYNYLYPNGKLNLTNFIKDFNKNKELLKKILGNKFSNKYIRCPGGTMSWKNMNKIIPYLKKNNIKCIDWNVSCGNSNIMEKINYYNCNKNYVILLLHETQSVLDTLPDIIKYYKDKKYLFKTL